MRETPNDLLILWFKVQSLKLEQTPHSEYSTIGSAESLSGSWIRIRRTWNYSSGRGESA